MMPAMSPSMSLQVRPVTPADAPAIGGLLADLGYPATPEAVSARLNTLAVEPAALLRVAERDDVVVGMVAGHVLAVVHADGPAGWITALVVAAGYRGQGIGRALLTAAERWMSERGCSRIAVTTHLRRADAHAFYEKLGYTQTGLRLVKPLSD